MCGRFVSKDQAAIERYFNVTAHQFQLKDRYNVAPTTKIDYGARDYSEQRVRPRLHKPGVEFGARSGKPRKGNFSERPARCCSKSIGLRHSAC